MEEEGKVRRMWDQSQGLQFNGNVKERFDEKNKPVFPPARSEKTD
jgi:hypothetical protein